jgi:hypothetical protein
VSIEHTAQRVGSGKAERNLSGTVPDPPPQLEALQVTDFERGKSFTDGRIATCNLSQAELTRNDGCDTIIWAVEGYLIVNDAHPQTILSGSQQAGEASICLKENAKPLQPQFHDARFWFSCDGASLCWCC